MAVEFKWTKEGELWNNQDELRQAINSLDWIWYEKGMSVPMSPAFVIEKAAETAMGLVEGVKHGMSRIAWRGKDSVVNSGREDLGQGHYSMFGIELMYAPNFGVRVYYVDMGHEMRRLALEFLGVIEIEMLRDERRAWLRKENKGE